MIIDNLETFTWAFISVLESITDAQDGIHTHTHTSVSDVAKSGHRTPTPKAKPQRMSGHDNQLGDGKTEDKQGSKTGKDCKVQSVRASGVSGIEVGDKFTIGLQQSANMRVVIF